MEIDLIQGKELPESERVRLVVRIVDMLQEKGCSFRQAEDILSTAQEELRNLPISKRLTFSELLDC